MARLKTASGANIAFAACVLFAALAALLTSCGGQETRLAVSAGQSRESRTGRPSGSGEVSSNVLFADYAGTQACAKCHAERVRTWLASPMHNMTREPALADIKGPFDGTTFRFKDDTARLETVGGARFISIQSKRFGAGTYRLTRVIGGHHREDYAGVLVASARADAAPLSPSVFQIMCSVAPGVRASTWAGPVASSWVTAGKIRMPMCIVVPS